jgi:hypothetical protein
VLWIGKEIRGRSLFHYLTRVHHGDTVTELGYDPKVMGNQEYRCTGALTCLADQIEYLSLNGDVKGGCWLIGDQEVGCAGDTHRNHNPLALTS